MQCEAPCERQQRPVSCLSGEPAVMPRLLVLPFLFPFSGAWSSVPLFGLGRLPSFSFLGLVVRPLLCAAADCFRGILWACFSDGGM